MDFPDTDGSANTPGRHAPPAGRRRRRHSLNNDSYQSRGEPRRLRVAGARDPLRPGGRTCGRICDRGPGVRVVGSVRGGGRGEWTRRRRAPTRASPTLAPRASTSSPASARPAATARRRRAPSTEAPSRPVRSQPGPRLPRPSGARLSRQSRRAAEPGSGPRWVVGGAGEPRRGRLRLGRVPRVRGGWCRGGGRGREAREGAGRGGGSRGGVGGVAGSGPGWGSYTRSG